MKRLLALVALALVAVPGAAGAGGSKTIGTRGEVLRISADGGNVAIEVATKTTRPCDSGSVWTPATGKVVRFQDEGCGKNAADRHFIDLTLAGSRAAWTDYDYGNHAYCIGPVYATLASPKGVSSGVCPDEPDNEDMYVEYAGDGPLLVARSYVDCDYSCGPDYTGVYQDQVTLYTVGAAGVKKLAAEKRNTRLLDVDAGRILLRDAAGKQLVVLDGTGRQVAALPVDAKAAWLAGAAQVSVPTGTTLHTYDVATGALAETCTLKAGAKLQDVEGGLAVYFTAGEVHLLTIATNADRVVARQKGLVQADLEPAGLFYAYNVPGGGSKPGRVTFVPASALGK